MSKTYEVYPTTSYIPTKEEIGKLAEKYLNIFLEKENIKEEYKKKLKVANSTLKFSDKSYINRANICMVDTEYDIYQLNIKEGNAIFVFFHNYNDLYIEFLISDLKNEINEKEIYKTIKLGYMWSIKRTAWQPVLANILYGFVAIAIAELTNGLIYSDDGAWNFKEIPLKAEEFLPMLLNATIEQILRSE
ncbi:hypothetical protein [Fusobacterium varium]|uniref:hypothetical protein n=3 Tax=Fusobacterium varium TaxID=856 RepID=UPI001F1D7E8E|nr:hypothetical protein [Fusobacterium varium]MCF2674785.1 hypothetical protein [Fusobacterium varium]